MREPALQARPHSAEPMVNTPSANAKVLFEPNRSLIQPEAGIQSARLIRYPVTTNSRVSVLAPKSRPSVGRATLTMVASMRSMNSPAPKAIATSHLYDTLPPHSASTERSDSANGKREMINGKLKLVSCPGNLIFRSLFMFSSHFTAPFVVPGDRS